MSALNCHGYINLWKPAVGAPEGCKNPLPGRGWTDSITYPLEHYHDIHPNRGFQRIHPALDFDAPTGTPVRAVAAGSVIWAGRNIWGYGNLVILAHGAGFRTLYAHLDTVLAVCGTVVVAGTPIGTVGETGQASFEHVHFEVRVRRVVDGKTQWWSCDPHRWLGAEPSPPVPPDDDEEDEENDMENLLRNGGFEADWSEERSHRCLVFPGGGGVEERDVDNIFTPPGWMTWFRHIPDTWDQPEVRDAWKQNDPNRVRSGEKGILLYTVFRRHDAGFLQVVDVEPGQRLRLTVWPHAWSNHNIAGHEECYDNGRCSCGVGTEPGFWWKDEVPALTQNQWEDARQNSLFAIGIDPTGGTDPYSGTVVWGRAAYIYNKFAQLEVEATAERYLATVFLRCITQWPFKHNDGYWDDAELVVVGNSEPPPPSDCLGLPRIDYKRTLVLLPPEADAEWAKAVAAGSWDEHRYTISGSADDAGIGALTDRNVIAVNPGGWGSDLAVFFEQYYEGVNYTVIEATTPDELRKKLSGPFDPGPPGPPPPAPRVTRGHIGLHLQTMIPGWLQYVRELRPPVCKVLASMQDVFGIKRACADTIVVWRHVTNDYGGILDAPDPAVGARRWVDKFHDSLYEVCDDMAREFPGLAYPYFYVESLNECYPSLNAEAVTRAANFDIAFCDEIESLGLPIKPAVFCAAVGNPHESEFELLVPLARKCQRVGGLMGYHNYWLANPDYGGVDHLWQYLAGRWAEMDEVFTAHGIEVRWYAGESGVVEGTSNGGVWMNPNGGWKSDGCYNGDWSRYLIDILRLDERLRDWNAEHGDRYLGADLFTQNEPYCGWLNFRLEEAQLRDIMAALLERYP